jgi:hypothetical protein
MHIADNAPLTAARFLALATRLGDDDMFSSDLSDAELQVGRWGVRCSGVAWWAWLGWGVLCERGGTALAGWE